MAELELARLPNGLKRVEARLEGNEFVVGATPSIADCTLLAALNFGRFADLDPLQDYPNIGAWFERYALRHL